jgi:hypothetical protein
MYEDSGREKKIKEFNDLKNVNPTFKTKFNRKGKTTDPVSAKALKEIYKTTPKLRRAAQNIGF